LNAGDLEGGVALLAGDIISNEYGIELYITLMSSGKVLLCSKNSMLSKMQIDKSIVSVPALADINGDAFLDIVYTDGENIYAAGPSGASLMGWPRNINNMHITTLKEHIESPLSVAVVSNDAYVMAVTRNGLLYTLDHTGELAGGQYPKRIAASIVQPLELTECGSNEGLIAYVDVLENGDGNYYSHRPEETAVEWLKGPYFNTDDITGSWSALFGNRGRTSFALKPEAWSNLAEAWESTKDNLIIYPNPSNGRNVGFHFVAPSGAEAKLQVFNLVGEIVLERTQRGIGVEQEFSISMHDKAAGIYIGSVVIKADGKSSEMVKKFAIVK